MLGATAIEDLLQDNVNRCIEDFRKAGIKVWMLTGDKGLTAEMVAISCGIFPQNIRKGKDAGPSQLYEIKDTEEEGELKLSLNECLEVFKKVKNPALKISGRSMAKALKSREC